MRVAILDPEPRVCGPTNWGFQLREGFKLLGHETQLISHTKSGRTRKSWGKPQNGGRWWSSAPDIVVKDEYLVPTLDAYDMIVLPEIKVPSQDKDAKKKGTLPIYVDALRRTKTPWTSSLHGSFYPTRDVPFVKDLFESPSRGNYLITMSDDSVEDPATDDIVRTIKWQKAPMPYTPQCAIDDPIVDARTVGTTGRFIFNKGQPIVCLAGVFLPADVTVEVWGSCAVGQGPSPTFIVYEILKEKYGSQAKRYPTTFDPAIGPDGNTVTPFPWDARPPGGALVRYLGNYTNQIGVAKRLGVHVNLTSYKFARGLVEYSTIEAADAGAINIVPKHLSDPQFRMMVIDAFQPFSSPKRIESPEANATAQMVAEKIMTCLDQPKSWKEEVVRHNREVMRTRNDPRICAQAMIDSAFSR
jgi:hypothetical protein